MKTKRPSRLAIIDHRKKLRRKTAEPFILETKLIPPVLKEGTISRQRLLSLLKKNLNRKLILITADAGYGKTTLLLQLLKEENMSYVFYTVDNNDAELTIFISHLAFALEKIQKDLCTRTKNYISQIQNPAKNYEMVMGTLINELLEKRKGELFIILDDYHNIQENSIVHKAMNYFIEHLPENIRVIISSRAIPQLTSIPRWRAKQDMFEMTRESLKCTNKEILSLLTEIYQLTLHKEETKRLIEYTEGWVTGIQLILQTVGKDGRTIKETLNGYLESNKPLFEYFANEVFRNESIEMRNFLKKTSIPEVITPDLCDKVFEMKNSAKLLKTFERKNLFLSEVGENQYKYHGLFRDFLQAQITDENLNKQLHLNIAVYYKKNEQIEQAIHHYLKAESYSKAAKVIEQIAEEFCDHGKFQILKEWIETLPKDVKKKHPRMIAHYARILLIEGRSNEAKDLVKASLKQLKKVGDKIGIAFIYYILTSLAWLRGDYRASVRFAKKGLHGLRGNLLLQARLLNRLGVAEGYIGNAESSIDYYKKAIRCAKKYGNVTLLSSVFMNTGVRYRISGQIAEAQRCFQNALMIINRSPNRAEPYIYLNLGILEMCCGNAEKAEDYYTKGIKASQSWSDRRVEAILLTYLGELKLRHEKFYEGRRLLEKSSSMLNEFGDLVDYCEPQLLLADLFIRTKSYSKAASILDNLQHESLLRNDIELYGVFLLEKGKLLLSQGEEKKSKQVYSQACRIFSQRRNIHRKITTEILLAEVSLMLGEKSMLRMHLRHALKAAQSSGFWGPFLIEKTRMKPLLEYTLKNSIEVEAASHLLTIMGEKKQSKVVVRLFGGFELEANGIVVTHLLKRKTTRAIFTYFLLHPDRAFTWEQIASLIWAESPPKSAHQMFLIALWEIRKASPTLKDFIVCGGIKHSKDAKYQLNPNISYSTDEQRFEEFINNAKKVGDEALQRKQLEQAFAIYQGPLLKDFYYSWIDDLRNRYERQYCDVLQFLVQSYHHEGNFERSNFFCEKYLAVDNLSEDIHKLIMENYIGLGKKSMAIKQYKKLKKILSEELKVEASSEITSLYNSLF
jgi:ATP/maltotriose-dependent transcriptional regulator MalT